MGAAHQRFLHPLGDFAQERVARLAAGAAGVEIGLEAVAQRPLLRQQLEPGLGDRLGGAGELRLRAADLRQHDDDAPFGAAPGELPGQHQRRPQVVERGAGRQEDDVAFLGELLGQVVGEAARVGDDEVDVHDRLAQLLEALERARVDFRYDRRLQPRRVPLDAGELVEVEVGEQRALAAMRRADREQPRQRALADAALLADEADRLRRQPAFAHCPLRAARGSIG